MLVPNLKTNFITPRIESRSSALRTIPAHFVGAPTAPPRAFVQQHKETSVTLTSSLAEHAFAIVVRDLEGFGNSPTDKHRQALRRIVETYSAMARGEITGRFAFDLPTGCGKTQSVVAWCQAVHECQSGHSVVIAASKVEELCDIKRNLIDKGVPADRIGLIHSKAYDPDYAEEWLQTRNPQVFKATAGRREYASLPSTSDNETRPFLLVTVMGPAILPESGL
jgi:hypothetical protein